MESIASAMFDLTGLFTEKHGSCERFIRFVRYPQGIRAFFLQSPLLRSGLRVLMLAAASEERESTTEQCGEQRQESLPWHGDPVRHLAPATV